MRHFAFFFLLSLHNLVCILHLTIFQFKWVTHFKSLVATGSHGIIEHSSRACVLLVGNSEHIRAKLKLIPGMGILFALCVKHVCTCSKQKGIQFICGIKVSWRGCVLEFSRETKPIGDIETEVWPFHSERIKCLRKATEASHQNTNLKHTTPRAVLSNMVATIHRWQFKCKLK